MKGLQQSHLRLFQLCQIALSFGALGHSNLGPRPRAYTGFHQNRVALALALSQSQQARILLHTAVSPTLCPDVIPYNRPFPSPNCIYEINPNCTQDSGSVPGSPGLMSSKVRGFVEHKRGLECMIVACLHVLLYLSLDSNQDITRLALPLQEFNKDAVILEHQLWSGRQTWVQSQFHSLPAM